MTHTEHYQEAGEIKTKEIEEEKICVCGDGETQHIDNCEQCFIPECGCKEFEPKEEE